jgi:hypothetical protein
MIKKRNCKSSFDKIFCFKKCKSEFFSNLDAHQENYVFMECRLSTFSSVILFILIDIVIMSQQVFEINKRDKIQI